METTNLETIKAITENLNKETALFVLGLMRGNHVKIYKIHETEPACSPLFLRDDKGLNQ